MMDKREIISPNMGPWQSPEEFPTSTPDSDGSSRQDSGYSSSVTPQSARSPSPAYPRFCRFCRKPVVGRQQSTPVCAVCTCRNLNYNKVQSPFECMTTIRESEITPSSPLSIWTKRNRPLQLDDDSMYASLYPDPEPEPQISNINGCEVNSMDMSDETSIDLVDKMFALPSSSAIEDKMEVEKEPVTSEPVLPPTKEPTKSLVKNFAEMIERVRTYNYVVDTFKSSMRGIDQVDFLFQLRGKRNCPWVIENIFSHLSDKDLNNVWLVSKTWKKCVETDEKAFKRLNMYKTKMMLKKENYSSPGKAGGSGGRRGGGRVLLPITNLQQSLLASPTRRSPPLSPSSARHRYARQVAGTMKKGDRVLKCPRCEFSVPDHGRSPSAQCRRSGCRHRFCVHCRGEINATDSHDCPPMLTPRSATKSASKMHPVGSKSCKRNLRRTLLGVKNS